MTEPEVEKVEQVVVCNLCPGKRFTVPAPIGLALMEEHLFSDHGLRRRTSFRP